MTVEAVHFFAKAPPAVYPSPASEEKEEIKGNKISPVLLFFCPCPVPTPFPPLGQLLYEGSSPLFPEDVSGLG